MKPRILIYPTLLVSALSLMTAYLKQYDVALVASALVFILLLFLLAALRRKPEASPIPPEFGAKLAALENHNQRLVQTSSEDHTAREDMARRVRELEAEVQSFAVQKDNYEAALASLRATAVDARGTSDRAVVQFLRSLQSRGRFLDFVMADIHRLPDPQVGAAARVVHQGLRSLIDDYFTIKPVREESEGQRVIIDPVDVGLKVQLLQSRDDKVPREGLLVHKGWRADALRLPQSQGPENESGALILAAAEIDVGEGGR